ncbi:MAG TPA: ferredoxin, partial [Firmicutes bacterium]|nr:ferredoxin [Bacillota bacterium]
MAVRLYVDQDLCISCGACVGICPDVFDWNDDEKAHVTVDPIPED